MHRLPATPSLLLVGLLALGLGGCSGQMFDKNEGTWFSKPVNVFATPDWARASTVSASDMDTGGPVKPEDLVGADGRCSTPEQPVAASPAAPPPEAQPASATANGSVGGMAGELANEPAPVTRVSAPAAPAAVDANAPAVMGGIALGMTECQAVRRAGIAGNVNISAGANGGRLVVLTYLSGPWPGIYHFADGRLKEIDRAPLPPEPAKPAPKKGKAVAKKKPPAKTSQREIETVQ